MRGSRNDPRHRQTRRGSIPAYAGEPAAPAGVCRSARVYPRVCGGARSIEVTFDTDTGLSPRMRGSLFDPDPRFERARSIPAYAGEPTICRCRRSTSGVYPRVCGGACFLDCLRAIAEGLSPRMRGSLPGLPLHDPRIGSIPAYAGEPRDGKCVALKKGVYPRVCGGALYRSADRHTPAGLSPRMRGSHLRGQLQGQLFRSIPAYAGEPEVHRMGAAHFGVYPRVCGGAIAGTQSSPRRPGLSPRMRGSLDSARTVHPILGSIPAYAGEPRICECRPILKKVYPRVCGGATAMSLSLGYYGGLSPRMRGSLLGRES